MRERHPGLIDGTRLLRLYYLVTPLFAALDLLVGISIRAAGIASPIWRAAYYVFAFGCWLALRRRPSWAPVIGVGESSVNLLLLILSVLGPIFAAPLVVAEGGDPAISFGVGRLFNFVLAGTVLILGFHGHQNELARRVGLGAERHSGRGEAETDEPRGGGSH